MDSRSRRRYLTAAGTLLSSAVAGCSGASITGDPSATTRSDGESPDGQSPERTAASDPDDDGTVASVAVPTTDTDYAVMGAATAPQATLYGGWKCPYTRQFVREQLPGIVREYVRPGALQLRFRSVRFQADAAHGDDEPRANRAGLAVWHERPTDFWSYFAQVFAAQPPETREWATVDALLARVEDAGINRTGSIERAITAGRYEPLWRETMDRVHGAGIEGIPRLELDGRRTAPTLDPGATRRQLEAAVGDRG